MDGLLRCCRYAFGPNRLHYCGPDATSEIAAYIKEGESDPGLTHLLEQFKTMFPYLRMIAEANGIRDPFDSRVVEAYWIGNTLLEAVTKEKLYRHCVDTLHVKKKRMVSDDTLAAMVSGGAVPHHSFHVFSLWERTGHREVPHTLVSLDACRIGAGKVLRVDGPKIVVAAEPLLFLQGKFVLGESVATTVMRRLEAESDIEQLRGGEIVTMHWGVPCEVITEAQARTLRAYTLRHIALANRLHLQKAL